ncbi:MAG: cryptochrome/photolyase family protein [Arhodomonas sp.]|nr:cryptochrome/photolyase family protein [Arhodomonas sp.]
MGLRQLVLVLGDQLDAGSAAFDDFDPTQDAVWMAEVAEEATHVPAHQQRLVLFFSAMRHFRDRLQSAGIGVHYHALGQSPADDRGGDFAALLRADVPELAPQRLVVLEPGDWRVQRHLQSAAAALGLSLEQRMDRRFYCSRAGFREWASGRSSLVLEYFYRHLRRRHGVLMDGDRPAGGVWNFDRDNRVAFGRDGPGNLPPPPAFAADALTGEVAELVGRRFADHPGDAARFDQPVTPEQAETALEDFVQNRLPSFGTWQDAIWTGEPFLYHSRLSAALNLHLLDPRQCVDAAVAAWEAGRAPVNAVEGFVRQVLGWREFVRGIYWLHMPEYAGRNALGHDAQLPAFYWDGDTDMACIADAMGSVLAHGYAHHIQRLMVLGLFAQLYGVHPYRFHEWHMAMYLDAVDWVSLPNTLGMSQYGDGGIVGSKPYCASGAYINRMSNACGQCRYQPKQATGERACPFTTLYWDFLARHAHRLRGNRRLQFQLRNLERKPEAERTAIRKAADRLRGRLASGA